MKKEERSNKQREKLEMQVKDVESQLKKDEIMVAMEKKDQELLDVFTMEARQEETTQTTNQNSEATELHLTPV